jgi:AcrR family transcriptional regulator
MAARSGSIVEQTATQHRAARRAERKEARRRELVRAAASVFLERGVAAASVDDIVGRAGVAKGTFYLYFTTKDEVVTAVAEAMVEGVADRIETMATAASRSPVERLLSFATAVGEVGGDEYERDLIEIFHRPENKAIHDRMSEQALRQLAPIAATIVADGIAAGLFAPIEPRRAAAYVLACFGALHEVVHEPADLPVVTDELNVFVLRGLGYRGEVPRA